MSSDYRGDCNLMETVGALTSVEDIWSGLTSVETDHVTGAGAAEAGRDYWLDTDVCWRYLSQDRRLFDKFGRGPCRFGIFELGSTSVEDVDAPIEVPGEDMPCGYIGSQ